MFMHLFVQLRIQTVQQPLAPRQHVPPGCLEIFRVPWIGDIAGIIGKIHQEMDFVGKVAAADPVHIPQIGFVHPDQQVVFLVVAVDELPGCVAAAGDPMLGQLAACRRIDWVPNFLSAGSCRCDLELRRQSSFFHQVLHDELGHWAPANIAVTHEEDLFHRSDSPP